MNLIYGRCKLNHTIEKGVYASLNNGSSYPKITQIFSSDSVLGSNSAYSRLKQGALSVFKEKVNIAENIARQVVKGVSKNSAINPGVRLVGAMAETAMISLDIEKVTELADMLSERLALQPGCTNPAKTEAAPCWISSDKLPDPKIFKSFIK